MNSEVPQHARIGPLQLRPVAEADYPFMRVLYRAVRSNELLVTNWTETQKDDFCNAQFAHQDQYYRANYPLARFCIIEHEGRSIGRLYLSDEPTLLALMDITLATTERGKGHGTMLMHWLTDLADQGARLMRLYVESDNPALRLYARFGFQPDDQHGIYIKMLRAPQPLR